MKLIPLSLTYDNDAIQDGLGAQILRVIGVRALSEYFKLGYIHNGIKNLHVHQLDSAQTESEIELFIKKTNSVFNFENRGISEFDEVYKIHDLGIKVGLKYILRALIQRKRILLRIAVPFYLTNRFPQILNRAQNFAPDLTVRNSSNSKIVIHFRAGFDSKFVDPGRTRTRFIPLSYFEGQLKEIFELNPRKCFEVVLLTDAPPTPMEYIPLPSQLGMWEKSGFEIKNGSINIPSLDLTECTLLKQENVQVVHGGDPLEALKIMASADHLILSRSTLSFVGGLLNRSGRVIYPVDFGQKPLKRWVAGKNHERGV